MELLRGATAKSPSQVRHTRNQTSRCRQTIESWCDPRHPRMVKGWRIHTACQVGFHRAVGLVTTPLRTSFVAAAGTAALDALVQRLVPRLGLICRPARPLLQRVSPATPLAEIKTLRHAPGCQSEGAAKSGRSTAPRRRAARRGGSSPARRHAPPRARRPPAHAGQGRCSPGAVVPGRGGAVLEAAAGALSGSRKGKQTGLQPDLETYGF